MRRNVSSGGPWEAVYGYSRAVRVGDAVHVSGTTAAVPEGAEGGADAGAQARVALARIAAALQEAGCGLEDVVRTRMFIVDAADADAVGRAHGEAFADVRPAATMVVVSALIRPDLLVEIEADAVVGAGRAGR